METTEQKVSRLHERIEAAFRLILRHADRHGGGGADATKITTSSHTRLHSVSDVLDHSGSITSTQHGILTSGDLHTEYQKESEREAASGYAGLDASSKVIKDPANATATPTASKIPIAGGTGKLAAGWIQEVLAYADLTDDPCVAKATYDAQSILAAVDDNTPAAVTVAEQRLVGRLTGGNIDDITIGIANDNIVQMDQADAADNDFAKFTANGLEGRSYTEVKSDLGLEADPALHRLLIHIDGGGSAITTGIKVHIPDMPACAVEGWSLVGNASGSIVLDFWTDSWANSPPTVADTMIATGTKPVLSSAQKNQDLTIDWAVTAIAAGATLTVNVDSATTVTWVDVTLRLRMS